MVRKNNKKNRRRAAFYGISKFDYKVREKLAKRQLSPKETPEEKKTVEPSSENAGTETWIPKITIVQKNSQKAQANELLKGLETRTDLKNKMQ